jgi:aldehyde:ferredoxin oxidoreductase
VKQSWSDFGCPTCCLKIAMVKTGRFKGAITDNPDYELQAYLGPNLGIFTPEENVFLTSLIDDLGLCGIQTGNVLGFAAELFQRGILTETDLDGIELKWGDAEAFAELARKIALRQGMGNLLAEGTYRAALKISQIKNVDVMKYTVQSKGISIGAHGIRSGKDYPANIAYVCSVQGGDHTSAAGVPLCGSKSEVWEIFNDSGVNCMFNSFGVPRNILFNMYEAITGLHLTRQEWCKPKALRIIQIQRAMLLLGDESLELDARKQDANPPRFYEPLPSGPYKGKTADKAEVEEDRRRYYEEVGWDAKGIPKAEILRELGLDDVDLAVTKLRQTSWS